MKKIGIVGHFANNTFGITKPYVQFFSHFGNVEVITPYDMDVRSDLDLLVLPGGPDVNPERYLEPGEDVNLNVGQPCMIRERFDRFLLPKYIENKVPIFGICRGHQTLAVHFGAKLNQDMYHETSKAEKRYEEVHDIKVIVDNLGDIQKINNKDFKVNSLHHQTVEFAPDNAKIIGLYDGKENEKEIEALTYKPNYPAHTVQWHPEEIRDEFSISLILDLLYPEGYQLK